MSDKGMTPLGTYCLIPRATKTGKTYIARADWEDWFGDVVAVNEHRVSGWYADRIEAVPFCIRYARANPGCVTAAQARELKAVS